MDSLFPVAIILHVIGASILLASAGIELIAVWRLRRARTVGEARAWSSVGSVLSKTWATGAAVQLITGIYMGIIIGWSTPWLDVSFLTFVCFVIAGPILNGRPMEKIHHAVSQAADGDLSGDLAAQVRDGAPVVTVHIGCFAVMGVFILMVGGSSGHLPGWPPPIMIIVLAGVVGWISAVLMGRGKTQAASAAA